MVLDGLGSSLRSVLSKVAKSMFVDEKAITSVVKELQRALLMADVNTRQVLDVTKTVKTRALNEKPQPGITKREQLIHIVYEELVRVVGGKKADVSFDQKPTYVLLVGLFGSGKTTMCGKLAHYWSKRGKKVAVLGLDVYRPAAMTQLKQLGDQIKVPVYVDDNEKNAVRLFKKYETQLQAYDVVLVDSSGRDALNDELIQEIREVAQTIQPQYTWLIISGDIGQAAKTQATAFKESCGVNGVIVTKLDGTAKGGGALTAAAITQAPIMFIGVGEKPNDLEPFNPEGFIGRLLGMGDLSALLDKVQGAVTEEDAKHLEKRLLKGEFNLLDLYQQMEAMGKMGSFEKILEMVPGMGQLKLPKDAIKTQEGKLKIWRYAMNSMTKKELEEPECISNDRVDRISKGSGVETKEIRELLKQHKQAKKMVKMLKGGSVQDPQQLMKKLGKKKAMKFKRM